MSEPDISIASFPKVSKVQFEITPETKSPSKASDCVFEIKLLFSVKLVLTIFSASSEALLLIVI